MPRWNPDADSRLLRSAMQLFLEQGYDEVTVTQIAQHAGLTKRSFFRYFADKKEVLFAGAAQFHQSVVTAVAEADPARAPIDAVADALAAAGTALAAWGEPVRLRQRVIDSSRELQEREDAKLADLATALTETLKTRGSDDLSASMIAHAGIAAYSTAFTRWTQGHGVEDFPTLMHQSLDSLQAALTHRAHSDGRPVPRPSP